MKAKQQAEVYKEQFKEKQMLKRQESLELEKQKDKTRAENEALIQ